MLFPACKLDCGLARGSRAPLAAVNGTISAVLVPEAAHYEPRSGSVGLFNTRDPLSRRRSDTFWVEDGGTGFRKPLVKACSDRAQDNLCSGLGRDLELVTVRECLVHR